MFNKSGSMLNQTTLHQCHKYGTQTIFFLVVRSGLLLTRLIIYIILLKDIELMKLVPMWFELPSQFDSFILGLWLLVLVGGGSS